MLIVNKLDQYLLDLAWSLWTELGVLGHRRKHRNCLISLEELVLLTALLAELDPRLRDESLDWCSQYHHFFSVSRLKSLIKHFEASLEKLFSKYSSTLNSISSARWPTFYEFSPWKIVLSHKSCLRPLESPALLNIRARSLFGTGARADLVTLFLIHEDIDFSVSDTMATGYSKSTVAEILDELCLCGLINKSLLRNQQRYRLVKREQLLNVLGPYPEYAPSWQHMLEMILSIRNCLQLIEHYSKSSQIIEIRNLLITLQEKMQKLKLSPPVFRGEIEKDLKTFEHWLLDMACKISQGDFSLLV